MIGLSNQRYNAAAISRLVARTKADTSQDDRSEFFSEEAKITFEAVKIGMCTK